MNQALLNQKVPTTTVEDVMTDLQSLVSQDMKQVNTLILEQMVSEIPLIPQLAAHLIMAGGKRIRPLLTLAGGKLCGYEGPHIIKLAAAIEFIHNATLLHDDVVDMSDLRRGQSTANALWGNQASVLVGDFLFARAFQLMVSVENLEALAVLSKTSATISEGEVFQLSLGSTFDVRHEDYYKIIQSKTGALFEASCQMGAILGNATSEQRQRTIDYGHYLGIVFQIIDDVLDYTADEKTLGKKVGGDFKERKLTLPIMVAYENSSPAECAFWERTIVQGDQNDSDFSQALAYIQKTQAIDFCMQEALTAAQKAKDSLRDFADSPTKEILLNLVDYCISRQK